MIAFSRLLVTAFAFALLAGCGSSDSLERRTHHALTFTNVGGTTLTAVRIRYGKHVFPSSLIKDGMAPGVSRAEIRTLAIPQAVSIAWQTPDGVPHMTNCPLRSRIKISPDFHGIEFEFADYSVNVQQVDVYKSDGGALGFASRKTPLCSFTAK